MEQGYECECMSPHCGAVFWSEVVIERCIKCGGSSLKIEKENAWEGAHTESFY